MNVNPTLKGLPTMEAYKRFVDHKDLRAFLQNVFQQVNVEGFMKIYKEAVEQNSTSEGVYNHMVKNVHTVQGGFFRRAIDGLKALKGERGTLADNVGKVMDPLRPKDGYVEITLPGRMIKAIAPKMGLTGKVTVINEKSSAIEAGFPKAYNEFQTLTYDPINVPANSVDVVSVFAGLHHCPPDKLEAFVQSISDAMRVGGTLLVRDHDTQDEHLTDLASVIHSVFNACYKTPLNGAPDTEMEEVRNFQSVDKWIELLERHNFKVVYDTQLIRTGDSSLNTLLKFVKVSGNNTDADKMNVAREMLIGDKPNYTRPMDYTHQTTVEWFNVESTKNLATQTFYNYPYFRDVIELFKCNFKSWRAARQVTSFKGVLTSEHTVMSAVITTLMTVEYLAKAMLYTPIWLVAKLSNLRPSKSNTSWDKVSDNFREWHKGYGERLNTIPYYAQSFLPYIKDYWKEFDKEFKATVKDKGIGYVLFNRSTLLNITTGIVMTIDLLAKAAISAPINWFLGGAENGDDRKMGILYQTASGNIAGEISERYKALEDRLAQLMATGATIREIAGQAEIQIDLLVDKKDKSLVDQPEYLYERICLEDDTKKIIALRVSVDELKKYFENHEIYRVCDF